MNMTTPFYILFWTFGLGVGAVCAVFLPFYLGWLILAYLSGLTVYFWAFAHNRCTLRTAITIAKLKSTKEELALLLAAIEAKEVTLKKSRITVATDGMRFLTTVNGEPREFLLVT